ncbi:nucleotide pyrophosphohydrolase [Bifidobacterium lemurum]|uniref:Nucleotide pyrophosphohydrolase n=2 Tax=Bifidobacterium lemurum TaxID=1603886 RepID=A0A261FP25_9BIFI|nr:nucleotide pyrophosphohydrolase [Bifidobacterium lemurum]
MTEGKYAKGVWPIDGRCYLGEISMGCMTEAAHDDYQLPAGFERCSKLDPVVQAPTALERARVLVTILANPGGCPWDEKQTNTTLLKNLLEETYEFVDTVEENDREGMREELGDLLMQSLYQAAVCEKDATDPFTLDEVCDRLVDKLITRHPNVFAPDDDANTGKEESAEEVLATWNQMKQREKRRKSAIEGISHAQGAFPRAAKIVHRVAKADDSELFVKAIMRANTDADSRQSTPDDYADQILRVIQQADADGVDIESALRNRLRDIEQRIIDLESSAR